MVLYYLHCTAIDIEWDVPVWTLKTCFSVVRMSLSFYFDSVPYIPLIFSLTDSKPGALCLTPNFQPLNFARKWTRKPDVFRVDYCLRWPMPTPFRSAAGLNSSLGLEMSFLIRILQVNSTQALKGPCNFRHWMLSHGLGSFILFGRWDCRIKYQCSLWINNSYTF